MASREEERATWGKRSGGGAKRKIKNGRRKICRMKFFLNRNNLKLLFGVVKESEPARHRGMCF